MVWTVLKSALTSHTQTKIHILPSNYGATLSTYVAPENLPADLRQESPALAAARARSRARTTQGPGPPPPGEQAATSAAPRSPTGLDPTAPTGSQHEGGRSSGLMPSPRGKGGAFGFQSRSRQLFKENASGECGSVVLAVSNLELSTSFSGSCRVTVRAAAEGLAVGAAVDSQEIQLPMEGQRCFVLSLGPDAIQDQVLRLHFSLALAQGAPISSTLEVLLDGASKVEGLLCWVSFYDARGRSVSNLKALLSYQPPVGAKPPPRRTRFSLNLFKKNKKASAAASNDDPTRTIFEAKQLVPPRPAAEGDEGAAFSSEEEEEEGGEGGEDMSFDFVVRGEGNESGDASGPTDMESGLLGSYLEGVDPAGFFGNFLMGVDNVDVARGVSGDTEAAAETTPKEGKDVAYADDTLDWAIWYQDISLDVKKVAFTNERSARAAFSAWSFVRILTRRHREVDVYGIIFAPSVGKIRVAIESSFPKVETLKRKGTAVSVAATEQPQAPQDTEFVVYSMDPGASAMRLAEEPHEWCVPLTPPRTFSTVGIFLYLPTPRNGLTTNGLTTGCECFLCRAIWTSEWFEVRRYGFASEAAARLALEDWLSVRILTRGEEEVTARNRWHSDALLTIRETIEANLK